MLYQVYEMQRALLTPIRAAVEVGHAVATHPLNPWSHTPVGRYAAAATEMFERGTRAYGKPAWDIDSVQIDGTAVPVVIEPVLRRTFCRLTHFRRETERNDPKLLIVTPLSGHFATLLRDTVEAMLPEHDVYITDWRDAREVPLHEGNFNLDFYVDYVIDFLHFLGPNTHVMAVCQPSVPVMAATAIMSSWGDACVPASMTLMGGPIDTRKCPTAVNKLAAEHSLEWFEKNVITTVPIPYPGAGRRVYPGFVQLTNFIGMNLERHTHAHQELFNHLVVGDEDSADKKRAFYNEFLAVMDLPADFYLQTVKTVFQDHALPKGEMVVRWQPVMPERITHTAILCVEGERDDISGVGQTKAALEITTNLPDDWKAYHLQQGAGHFGVFNGSRWRNQIAPRVRNFIRSFDRQLGDHRQPAIATWKGADRRATGKEKTGA
jgi:poly(3-hydroxybutyrate) depolymerase